MKSFTSVTKISLQTSEKISENVHIFANDPSLAFYRVQEHIRKVLPPIFDKRHEVLQVQFDLQGHCYDMEYGVQAIKLIEKSEKIFHNIQEMIKTSIFLRQQLNYEGNRKKSKKDTARSSVYKRFSAHIAMDLSEPPDLGGVVRETSQRMETISTPENTRLEMAAQLNLGDLQRSHSTLH